MPFLTHHSGAHDSLPLGNSGALDSPYSGSQSLFNSHQCPASPLIFFPNPFLIHKAFADHLSLSVAREAAGTGKDAPNGTLCPLPH